MVRENPLILILYLDDLFITGRKKLIATLQERSFFRVQDERHRFATLRFGYGSFHEDGHIFLGKGRYTVDILNIFQMEP